MSDQVISHAQFAAMGSGSRRFSDGSLGPQSGYYVSRPSGKTGSVPHGTERSREHVTDHKATAVDVAHHWSQQRGPALAETPPHRQNEVYQGLWHDESGGKSYLDVSDRIPGSFKDAVRTGLRNKQIAVYDANRGASVYLTPGGDDRPVTATDADIRTKPATARYIYSGKEKKWL